MIEQTVLIGLGAWRLASLMLNEDGPFDIFIRLRKFIEPPPGELTSIQVQILKIFNCIWCATVWTALLLFLVWLITPWPVVILAGMTIAVLVEEVINNAGKHQD